MTTCSLSSVSAAETNDPAAVYLRPLSSVGVSNQKFEMISISEKSETRSLLTREELAGQAVGAAGSRVGELLGRIDLPPRSLCGLSLDKPLVMGVLNVTPDSFSDGGKHFDSESAINAAFAMQADGADIIDVGGASSRPGSSAPSESEEKARILPVIETLARAGMTVSVDTQRASVMRAGICAGASIINDISALTRDAESLDVLAKAGVPVILMHMQAM